MAYNRTVRCTELTPGETCLVRGKVGFCRITRHTTDKEREEANKRRVHTIDRNYTTITIYEASVMAKDPNNPTPEEKYALEHCYVSSSSNYPGQNFSGINKTRNLPRVAVQDSPNHYTEIVPEGELATGLDVILVMRTYKGLHGNNGVSLDLVMVTEPIRYYSGSTLGNTLSSFGLVFDEKMPARSDITAAETNNSFEIPGNAAPAMQTVAVAPAPYQAAPAPAPYQAAPAPAPAPVYQTAPTPAPAPAPAFQAAPAAAPVEPATQPTQPAGDNPFSSYADAGLPNNIQFGPGTRQY